MGGTFDPIHNGHIALALAAAAACEMDQVLFIPNRIPPHKGGTGSDEYHRSAMVKLAIEAYPRFCFSDMELKREGRSFAVDTVADLRKEYGDDTELWFINGADSALTAPHWVRADELCELCRFVAAARPGWDLEKLKDLPEKWQRNIRVISMDVQDISATEIRSLLAKGRSVHGIVPDAVEQYIAEYDLYRGEFDVPALEQLLDGTLPEKRARHSRGVADLAEQWAIRWGADPEKAYVAGLLHDIARRKTFEEMIALSEKDGYPLNEALLADPLLLHGPAAAYVIRTELGITDPEILEAVRHHTIAKPGMGVLAKIIFLADICEPNRVPWPEQAELKTLCETDLDRAMAAAIRHTIVYVEERGGTPYPDTRDILAQYEQIIENKENR